MPEACGHQTVLSGGELRHLSPKSLFKAFIGKAYVILDDVEYSMKRLSAGLINSSSKRRHCFRFIGVLYLDYTT